MIRGILLGSVWGLVLGGGFLAVISLMYPATVLPPPETSSEVGSTAEPLADAAPARLPTPLSPPERHDAAKVTRPDQDNVTALAEGQDPGPAPELTAPDAGLGEGPAVAPTSDLARVAPDSAVLPSPLAMAPMAPASDVTPEITTKPALPPRAEPGETVTGFPTDDLTQMATAPEPAAQPDAIDENQKPIVMAETPAPVVQTVPDPVVAAPEAADEAAEAKTDEAGTETAVSAKTEEAETPSAESTAPVSERVEAMDEVPAATEEGGKDKVAEDDTPAPSPQISAKPQTTQDAPTAETTEPDTAVAETSPEAAEPTTAPATVAMPGAPGIRLTEDNTPASAEPEQEEVEDTRPPIDRYAAPFENPEGRPIVSIVLLDSERDGATIDMPARFPYPVSVAVPVDAPDAASRMRRYRDAGYEVLALAELPTGATPADIKTISSAWFDALPEAVAIMERPPATLQSDRANGEQLADILTDSGHGLLLFPDGLDTTRKLAARQGVPAATVFRDLDGAGQGGAVVRRFLDHSAFKAGVEGSVILVTRLRPDTLEALLVWGLADRAARVALAPVSYALKAAAP